MGVGGTHKDRQDLANLEHKLGAGVSQEPGELGADCGFCLAPNSHPLFVFLPGRTQPSQPDDSASPRPATQRPVAPVAGHAVPFLWRFLARCCRAWLTVFSVLKVPLGAQRV